MPPRYIDLTKMVADAEREYIEIGERPLEMATQLLEDHSAITSWCAYCCARTAYHCNDGRAWCIVCGREQA